MSVRIRLTPLKVHQEFSLNTNPSWSRFDQLNSAARTTWSPLLLSRLWTLEYQPGQVLSILNSVTPRLKAVLERYLHYLQDSMESDLRAAQLHATPLRPPEAEAPPGRSHDPACARILAQVDAAQPSSWEEETSSGLLRFSFDPLRPSPVPTISLNTRAAYLLGATRPDAAARIAGRDPAAPPPLPELDAMRLLAAGLRRRPPADGAPAFYRLLRRAGGGGVEGVLVCATRHEDYDALGRLRQVGEASP